MQENAKIEKVEKPEYLPPTDDPYWDKSEKVKVTYQEMNKDCRHHFLLIRPNQAQCKICNFGLFLELGDEVKDGKLYREGRVII